MDRENSKGYGFVRFEIAESVERAIQKVNGTSLAGQKVFVFLIIIMITWRHLSHPPYTYTATTELVVTTLSAVVPHGCSTTFHKTVPITPPPNASSARSQLRTSWNEGMVTAQRRCRAEMIKLGVRQENVSEDILVLGSHELPFIAQSLANSGNVDAVIAIGVPIKGETMHFEHISGAPT